MKHELPLGILELPDNWEDRTTYQFVSPPQKGLEIELIPGSNGHINATRTSTLLARALLPENTKIKKYLKQQTKELRKALPHFELNDREPWQHPDLGEVHTVDCTFEIAPGMSVRQLQFYFPTDDEAQYTNLTISCNASQYSQHKAEMQTIFESYSKP